MANNRELSQFANVVGYNGGNIGIGTDNPLQKLHLIDTTSANIYLQTHNAGTGSTAGVYFRTSDSSTADGFFKTAIVLEDDGTSWARGKLHILQDNTADNSNATLDDSVLTIDQSGRLLVGHDSNATPYVDGKVQVSATDSSAALSIARYQNTSSNPYLALIKSRGGLGNATIVQDNDGLGYITFVGADGNDLTSEGAAIAAEVDGTPGQDDMPGALIFKTTSDGSNSASERLRIDSLGRVLIDTTADRPIEMPFGNTLNSAQPGKLVLEDSGAGYLNMIIARENQSNAYGPAISLVKSRGTSDGSYTVVQSGDNLGTIQFGGADGSADRVGAAIVAQVDNTPGSDDMPGRLMFATTEDGSGHPTERLRITHDGKVHIGDSLGNNHSGMFQVIHEGGGNQTNDCLVFFETNANDWCIITNSNEGGSANHYHMYFMEEGSVRGSIYGTHGSNVTYGQGSDYRWKENIIDLTGTEGIDICKRLRPRKYNWIKNRQGTGQINTVDGFIAHEVQEAGVLGAVTGEKDAVNEDGSIDGQMLDYGQMTPVLAAGIKGLIAKVETLEAQNADLLARVTALENP